jgi:hypothetical protein
MTTLPTSKAIHSQTNLGINPIPSTNSPKTSTENSKSSTKPSFRKKALASKTKRDSCEISLWSPSTNTEKRYDFLNSGRRTVEDDYLPRQMREEFHTKNETPPIKLGTQTRVSEEPA